MEGGMFSFDTGRAALFIERGAHDAVTALDRAGWLAG